jgi:N-acetylglucosaminyldiphosphoundecaprenol N-acetyl-beta-D-mannosaminyltransferase
VGVQVPVSSNSVFELIEVSVSTREMLLADLGRRLQSGRGFGLATLNVDHLVKLRRHQAFRSAYLRHTHVVADGNPVVWLHRLAGRRIHLITGSDLVEPLMELAARRQVPVMMFGSTLDVLDDATRKLTASYPGLKVVGRISPTLAFEPTGEEATAAISAIRQSGARLCLLALGAPKQELFAAYAMDQLPDCGFVSIGAGLDFIAGTQRRAPKFVRALAMEWLWRLMRDHRRLARRYFDCFLILPGLFVAALQQRFNTPISKAPEAGE